MSRGGQSGHPRVAPGSRISPVLATDADDAVILALLLARDPMAVELAYDRWAPTLYSMAFMITQNEDAAERSLLDAYLEMWRRPELALSRRGTLLRYLGGLVITAAHAVTPDP